MVSETQPSERPAPLIKGYHHKAYPRIDPTRPELSAAGKNVVITGGSAGIGTEVAIAFAKAGASSVSILGRNEDRLKACAETIKAARSNADTKVSYYVADLNKRGDLDRSMDSIVASAGKISVFVSNAGELGPTGALASLNVDQFMSTFDSNVRGALNAVQAFLPRASKDAILINMSTGVAHIAPRPQMAVISSYAASKAANLKMMDWLAAENPDIFVVNVSPGIVATDMNVKSGVTPQDEIDLPAAFCVWLASAEARFLKSKFVWANWDVDELMSKAEEIQDSSLFTWMVDGAPM
ncbi:NAD(P)-binding protein [Rhizodiscina lignyota]|uniref:NAD(P)-binding protein n=1 Tax=Rhizodiscina lignyota TaxID=1504668 RepID=A0A9P4IFQ4_9PEZI|nr:NAD(P)-binding protein [Rhizodiscina lignyota]